MADYEELSDSNESFVISIDQEPDLSGEESEESPRGARPYQFEPIITGNGEQRGDDDRMTEADAQSQIIGRLSMPVSEW